MPYDETALGIHHRLQQGAAVSAPINHPDAASCRGDDALLVRYLNSHGQIDDIHELFGDETTLIKEQLQQIPIGAPDPADPYRYAPGFGKLAA